MRGALATSEGIALARWRARRRTGRCGSSWRAMRYHEDNEATGSFASRAS